MTDEQLIQQFIQQVAESRATGQTPPMADVAVAQLIGIVGKNSPLKSQAIEALTQCNWSLALNFLSALTPPGMVFVPAGEFSMGSDEDATEQPPHKVWANSFYIDRAPVTNAQFASFWEDVAYDQKSEVWGEQEAGRNLIYFTELRRAPRFWFVEEWNQKEFPLVGVSWYEAVVFARWAGKRLPSEAEWEKAARGSDARRYPWGNTFDATRCNSSAGAQALRTVSKPGQFSPQGDSPYGVQDMAGNVWEWTSSLFKPYPYRADDGREALGAEGERVLRGGPWSTFFEDHLRGAYREHKAPDFTYTNTGFRCVCTVPPTMRV